MPYEIDFHPVGNGSKSGDAITMRYLDETSQRWRTIVIDGGYGETGEQLAEHIISRYGTTHVDHVVSTHPDNDHISGLVPILEKLSVGKLWLHAPAAHAGAMLNYFYSSRWTLEGLRARLQTDYPLVTRLIGLAEDQGTEIHGAFQGERIGPFVVLSPSRTFYEGLLPQFRDTPQEDRDVLATLGHLITGVGRRVAAQIRRIISEDYYTETLREGGTTAAENESSVILGGSLDGETILLTADAGLRALTAAIEYAGQIGLPLGSSLGIFQVPHHGSRNNLSPSILDRIVGPMATFGSRKSTACVVSAGPLDTTHPRQVVVNALVRRGLEPMSTGNGLISIWLGVSPKPGMRTPTILPFQHQVEEYD
ncbi:MBL fold metallo-hydrolase [Bosea sp. CS1GBMeth4]|uniref:ComEC/Rec2 family competence protein n=1 Tax=Bosea sp. CS1GBMeth4 TaxID=1892849 RepID=UPI0016472863|nr:MBL fold metallo-hydrolase [Bosea sp. CS1GBMeth4]